MKQIDHYLTLKHAASIKIVILVRLDPQVANQVYSIYCSMPIFRSCVPFLVLTDLDYEDINIVNVQYTSECLQFVIR